MVRFPRNLPRAVGIAACCLIAVLSASIATPVTAAHAPRWWENDSDSSSWSGAGAGWNGSSASDGQTTWTPDDTLDVEVRKLRIDRGAISPNGDDQGDAATVTFRLRRRSAHVTVRVVDAAGATVRQLGELRTARAHGAFSWDGRSDAGTVVPDGTYRVVLAPVEETTTTRKHERDPLAIDVVVDTMPPDVTASRPTLVQLRSLARRAGILRDARMKWARQRRGNGAGRGNRHAYVHVRNGRHRDAHTGRPWSRDEREWVHLWMIGQLRLPMTFTTAEAGEVIVTTRVGAAESSFETYRDAGRHSMNLVLPDYVSGARATITFASSDDAGNNRRHTIVVRLPAMPKPRMTSRSGNSSTGGGSSPAPVTGVPTGGGPFPDWLDPVMLRATYAAGVPQAWARSQALANIVYRESSYRPTAQNPTSTAYGLFQFLDQTWATVGCTKTSDAYRQSVCGLRYIQRRYRTPERAWAFWQANHWY